MLKKINVSFIVHLSWLVEFYDISSLVGYSMPYPVYTYIRYIWFVNKYISWLDLYARTQFFVYA